MIPIIPLQSSLLLLSCVNELLISNSTKTLEVFLLNYEEKFEMPVFRFDWNKGTVPLLTFATVTPDIYIIKTNITVLRTTLHYLEKRLTFNPKAKFIFIVDTLAEELFLDYFMEAYIEEMILIEHTSGRTFFLDKYKTVRNEISNTTLTKNLENCICSEGKIKCNTTVSFPIEYSSVRVGLSYNVPSVILKDDNSTVGIDVDVLKIIAAKMRLSIYFDTVDEYAGMLINENFSFNGALGSLEKKEVDLIVGGILPRSDSNHFFEFAGPTTVNRYVWIVPAARIRPFWKRLFFTYTCLVWTLSFITFLTIVIILTSVNGIMKGAPRMDREFLKLYAMCLTSVEVKQTELLSKKILFVSWYLFLLIFSNHFTAKLLSNFMLRKYEYQLHTLDEIMDVNWDICMFTDLAEYLNSIDKKKIMKCNNCEICTNRTAFREDLISIRSENIMAHDMLRLYLNKNGEPILFFLDEYFLITFDVVVFRKNHPIFARFNELLSVLGDSGIYGKIASKYTPKKISQHKIGWKALAYRQLSFIFKFVIYGLVLSIIIFVLEINVNSEN